MAKRRDVVLARVYFSDSPESKVRPCIILSDEKYIASGFVLAAPITTALDDYCLPMGPKDADCALAPGSSARVDGILKISMKNIIRKIGRVAPDFYELLAGRIVRMLK
ncbi:MAG: type II toxin-antitoxin system PemK/MazF family toxin [Candidatus Burarchaeum sp.]|nr:type II toxin-antitoxin system PemK/MazF family toxin [Candidatus Burarchaeum sp.]MDO8339105.1 type II toxin-antitoxin system PemK/MazF family toxin [Candidatus Burarchaeum sp.]